MNRTAIALLVIATSVSACAQIGQDEHSAHHPPGGAPRQDGMGPRGAMPDAGDRFGEQMRRMQDMHRRMQAATTPAERQALLDEHMRVMRSGMEMMDQMGSMGGDAPAGPAAGGRGPSPGGMGMPGAQASPGMADGGMGGMGRMMDMHAGMQRRMAMMEQMMQMMVDREAAMPRK